MAVQAPAHVPQPLPGSAYSSRVHLPLRCKVSASGAARPPLAWGLLEAAIHVRVISPPPRRLSTHGAWHTAGTREWPIQLNAIPTY